MPLSGGLLVDELDAERQPVAGTDAGAIQTGENNNVASPPDSITWQWSSGTISGTIEVFGRDAG